MVNNPFKYAEDADAQDEDADDEGGGQPTWGRQPGCVSLHSLPHHCGSVPPCTNTDRNTNTNTDRNINTNTDKNTNTNTDLQKQK